MWNMMNQAAAPMMKMMGNTTASNNLNMMNDMMNELNQFMMKNTQVQYATYNVGVEAMNEFAENVYTKMKNGEDMSNFMNVYSEWLATNDKHLTQLFATAEYSKMQAELNTFGMKLKQNMNAQMEKAMQNVPVVPRSEMDELYKTVYELRKRVNMLEKQLDTEEVAVAEAKTPAKKAAKNA
jgi:polyhydroxyalkanoate synthase subunit PhaE